MVKEVMTSVRTCGLQCCLVSPSLLEVWRATWWCDCLWVSFLKPGSVYSSPLTIAVAAGHSPLEEAVDPMRLPSELSFARILHSAVCGWYFKQRMWGGISRKIVAQLVYPACVFLAIAGLGGQVGILKSLWRATLGCLGWLFSSAFHHVELQLLELSLWLILRLV